MSRSPDSPVTSIATHSPDDVFVRGRSLCRELIGKMTFTEMTFFHVTGRVPTREQTSMVDACLVTLMEHGLTPSTIAARLVYSSAPEAMQSAVAAGLLAVGGAFVGTVEGCAALIERMLAAGGGEAEAARIAEEHRVAHRPVPGFGHPEHKPDDPRSIVLLQLARTHGVAGSHVRALEQLAAAVDAVHGRHLTINATGAVAAVLGDCGLPAEILRGFAVLARCAGLVGHVHEEQHRPSMRTIWRAAEEAVPYEEEP
ncbi:MAG TPA: citryl-CoA lyase [Polyangiaceae bacterium]